MAVREFHRMKESKPVRTTLYLPPRLWKKLRLEAVKRDETATALVVLAIEEWFKREKAR
jgi:hypothetical protein